MSIGIEQCGWPQGDVADARDACRELEEIARSLDTVVPGAIAAQALGAVDLAEGNAWAALGTLRRAFEVWQRINAPYAAARRARADRTGLPRSRGRGRGQSGDRRGSVHIRASGRRTGSRPDRPTHKGPPCGHAHGLTPRMLQVLRLFAAGYTNRALAAELFLSERTIERHLSNIFTKLDLSTRAAATAWAYEHDLI